MKKSIKHAAVLLLSVCSSVMTGCMKEDLDNMRKEFQELEEQVNSDAATLSFNELDEITGEDKNSFWADNGTPFSGIILWRICAYGSMFYNCNSWCI